jgi:hypothetical protein
LDELNKQNNGTTNGNQNTRGINLIRERVIRKFAEDVANGNIPGEYNTAQNTSLNFQRLSCSV